MPKDFTSVSFRDRSGFIYETKNTLLRQINPQYLEHYDFLISSKLYKHLVEEKLLLPHKEVNVSSQKNYKTIQPTRLTFISYPYEWSFSQLKDAALATLRIQSIALEHGMTLKDASAYNIQFWQGRPTLIDTLSFEKYETGQPWIAYRQFCQHFLAPLSLMSKVDIRLSNLLITYLDGIPLDLAAKMLPLSTKLNFGLLTHIHLHATSQKNYSTKVVRKDQKIFSKKSFLGLLDSLRGTLESLKWEPKGTEWADYYPSNNNYRGKALNNKAKLIEKMILKEKPKNVWDIGGNTGLFSRLASNRGIETLSFDIDPAAVELNYRTVKATGEKNLLPLLLDLTNPTPAIGWKNKERESILQRGPADMILALALVHHLAISNNLPLDQILSFFSEFGNSLVIEFVPKEDSQVKKLLASREDIFPEYNQEDFEKTFLKYFVLIDAVNIPSSKRILYYLKSKKRRA